MIQLGFFSVRFTLFKNGVSTKKVRGKKRHYDWASREVHFTNLESVFSEWSDRSLFPFSSTLCLSLELHSSYILSTSLISRILVTRIVMSSMRNWILQLWHLLPAHEALCTLAGTLSSTQPSSLAHTNACHCRPFPL